MDNKQDKPGLPMMTQAGQTEFSAEARQVAVNLINKIFKSLKAIFPAWTAALKDPAIESQARVEWLKGLIEGGIDSEAMVDNGLAKCRQSVSPFLPSIGQFVEWCKSTGEALPPMEACFAELQILLRDNRRDWHNATPLLQHIVRRNLDLYNYRQIYKDYDRVKYFEIAYKAAMFQLECGEQLELSPAPETLIENVVHKQVTTPENVKKGSEVLGSLLSMFDEPPPSKPMTEAEIKDIERLERLKSK